MEPPHWLRCFCYFGVAFHIVHAQQPQGRGRKQPRNNGLQRQILPLVLRGATEHYLPAFLLPTHAMFLPLCVVDTIYFRRHASSAIISTHAHALLPHLLFQDLRSLDAGLFRGLSPALSV